jgi:hypothetical protein
MILNTDFWKDGEIKKLNNYQKCVLLYLLTKANKKGIVKENKLKFCKEICIEEINYTRIIEYLEYSHILFVFNGKIYIKIYDKFVK